MLNLRPVKTRCWVRSTFPLIPYIDSFLRDSFFILIYLSDEILNISKKYMVLFAEEPDFCENDKIVVTGRRQNRYADVAGVPERSLLLIRLV